MLTARRLTRCKSLCSFRRPLHSVPQLTLNDPEHSGVGRLFTPAAYKTAWTEYQSFAIDNLNRVAAETEFATLPLIKTIVQTARQPENASIYNYAALAFSNHFFFDSLLSYDSTSRDSSTGIEHGTGTHDPATVPASITQAIEASFESYDDMRRHVSAVAESMVGSGFIWLVLDATSQLRLLSTYNAGTPFDFARLQSADPNTGLVPSSSLNSSSGSSSNNNAPSTAMTKTKNEYALYQALKSPYSLTPVACLSVWEHSYLIDFGVSGKKEYVARWFDTLDWGKVQSRIEEARPR